MNLHSARALIWHHICADVICCMAESTERLFREFASLRISFTAAMTATWFLSYETDAEQVGTLPLFLKGLTVTPIVFARKILPLPVAQKGSAIRNFVVLNLRAVIKEMYRAIENYAQEEGCLQALREQTDWFPFLEIVRTSIEHSPLASIVWRIDRSTRADWTLTWRDKTLTKEMNREPISSLLFGPEDALQLLADAEDFFKAGDHTNLQTQ